jgi:hypothetical protein
VHWVVFATFYVLKSHFQTQMRLSEALTSTNRENAALSTATQYANLFAVIRQYGIGASAALAPAFWRKRSLGRLKRQKWAVIQ